MRRASGVMFLALSVLSVFFGAVHASCPNLCSSQGKCNKYSQCECTKGYIGGDCSLKTCPKSAAWSDHAYSTDHAHAPAECSNRGICDRSSGECICMGGFSGSACERLDCNLNCNGNGKCYTMHNLASETRDSESKSYIYDTEFGEYGIWDAHKIQGCICDPLYEGYDCSQFACVRGDDPLTTGQVNEVQLIKCIASEGTFTLWYNGHPSASISFDATAETVKEALLRIRQLTAVEVEYSVPDLKACQINTNVIKITFTEQFGEQVPLVAMLDSTMKQSGVITVYADGVTPVVDFSGKQHFSVKGTKENEVCAGRGLCTIADGNCACFDSNGDTYGSSNGYGAAGNRGDCGTITSGFVVSTCPGQVACNGHGLCDTNTYKCSCNEGWFGGDCSLRNCPKGKDWWSYPTTNNQAHDRYSECSNMGICDPTLGQCVCRDGFYGEACQFMACGGGTTTPCLNQGRCMSMKELALWREDNGEVTDFTYGMDPNFARTWDADRVHGCLCDPGFTGYDCSLRTCPTGDDPFTYEDHTEVQVLTCEATEGTFTLSFREHTTEPIAWDANADDVRDALMKLPSMVAGGVVWQKSTRNSGEIHLKIENGEQKAEYNFPIRVFFLLDDDLEDGVLNHVKPERYHPAGDPVHHQHPHRVQASDSNSGEIVLPTRNPSSAFCNQDGNQAAIISFDAIHGDVPALKADTSSLGNQAGITVEEGIINIKTDGDELLGKKSIKGTTENIECNGRGLCNRDSGMCECFTDWASSDGKGKAGYIGDCGFKHNHKTASGNSWREDFLAGAGRMDPNPIFSEAN